MTIRINPSKLPLQHPDGSMPPAGAMANGRSGLLAGNASRQLAWAAGLIALSLVTLYLPTTWSLWHSLWRDPTHSHGPIVLAVVIWLFARGFRYQVDRMAVSQRSGGELVSGAAVFAIGLLVYVVGRSQSLYVLEVFSALPVLAGLIAMATGWHMVARLWFPFVFLLFLVPLPGSLIDTITHPLKLGVSWASEQLLVALGYTVSRSGVILNVGQYQMFVADACAGLTSLFMLEAFGLLYLNVVRHASPLRNVILAILIVPISFVSNVLRVLLLCLITYHFGDAAGQGFMHDFSGTVLFVAALALTVAADTGARALSRRIGITAAVQQADETPATGLWPTVRTWSGIRLPKHLATGLLAASAVSLALALALSPKPVAARSAGDLETLIPARFGEWTQLTRPTVAIDVLANEPGETTLNNPYDQVVMRAYRHSDGTIVDLAVAYGKHQRQEVKIHQPELCFNSQGFRVKSRSDTVIERPPGFAGPTITARHLYSESQMAKLAATYWIRIGKTYADSAWETRWEIFREGLRGRAVDGVLVRAAMQVGSQAASAEAHQTMNRFLADLLANGSPALRAALAP
jgi:exosortase B